MGCIPLRMACILLQTVGCFLLHRVMPSAPQEALFWSTGAVLVQFASFHGARFLETLGPPKGKRLGFREDLLGAEGAKTPLALRSVAVIRPCAVIRPSLP